MWWFVLGCLIIVVLLSIAQWRNESPDKKMTVVTRKKRNKRCWFTNRHLWEGRSCVRKDCDTWRVRRIGDA